MMDMHEKREKLQEYLREPGCTPIMCAYDVLSAKLIENAGFPIVYTGSFITGASQFGMAAERFTAAGKRNCQRS